MSKEVKKDKKPEKNSGNKEKKNFVKDFKAELKKVSWPTLKQLVNNTSAVIVMVLVTAVIVFVLDIVFESVNNYGVEKLKAIVTSSADETNTENNDTSSEESTETENGTSEENAVETEETTNTENEEAVIVEEENDETDDHEGHSHE